MATPQLPNQKRVIDAVQTLGFRLRSGAAMVTVILITLPFNLLQHLEVDIANRQIEAIPALTFSSTRVAKLLTTVQTSAPTVRGTTGGPPPAPAGMHWQLTFDDEFTKDRSIRTDLWNGNSWKAIPGDPRGSSITAGSTITTNSGGTLTTPEGIWGFGRHLYWCGSEILLNGQRVNFSCAILLLSYNGNVYAKDGHGSWTQWGGTIGDFTGLSLSSTSGVAFQPSRAPLVDGLLTTGNPDLHTAKFAQRFGYFEWRVKLPHDVNGEGDGLHPTIWLWPVGKTGFPGGCNRNNAEIDVTESDIGPNNQDHTFFSVHDYCDREGASFPYPAPGTANLAKNWHIIALYWHNDGSAQGSLQPYFDGEPQEISYILDAKSILWKNGAYVAIQMDPCVEAPFNDGVTCDSSTNFINNSFFIQYMRVWELVQN